LIDLRSPSLLKALTYTRKNQYIEATENGWDDTVRTVAVESGNEILRCTGNYEEEKREEEAGYRLRAHSFTVHF